MAKDPQQNRKVRPGQRASPPAETRHNSSLVSAWGKTCRIVLAIIFLAPALAPANPSDPVPASVIMLCSVDCCSFRVVIVLRNSPPANIRGLENLESMFGRIYKFPKTRMFAGGDDDSWEWGGRNKK